MLMSTYPLAKRMSKSKTVLGDLVTAIQQTYRSVQFSDAGTIDSKNLGLEIEGIGSVKLPLRPKGVREILAAAESAPYGKGAKTIIDQSVRDSLEIKSSKIKLAESWNAAVESAVRFAAGRLGLPADRIQAKLYKLLIYQKGGFFLPHRDSEKQKGMVGSLIVMLPSSFGGGELVVEHGDSRRTFRFEKAASGETAEYVAFYSDCQHEVCRVTRGVRVCLAYNLVVKPQRRRPSGKDAGEADDALVAAVSHWIQSRPREPMVFALEHQYTANGLKPDLLKGNDRYSARHMIQAARAADCRVYFGQVSRHLLQFADDGSLGRGRYWTSRHVEFSELEVGETYDDEVIVDGWKDAEGKRVSMGALPLDGSMLVSSIPLEQWKPTSQDFEGYTGNAGNTLDRWYHKSAVVLWASRHHFDVLVRMGMQPGVEALLRMRKELAGLPDDDLEQHREDCESLARAIINAWPDRRRQYQSMEWEEEPWLAKFAAELPKFEEPDLVGEFLQTVADRDWQIKLDKLIMESCRRFGADKMAPLLDAFLSPPPNQDGRLPARGLAARDAAWLCKLACDRKQGGMTARQLAKLCRAAASRFSKRVNERAASYGSHAGAFDGVLAKLLKAALATHDDICFRQLLHLKRSVPRLFDIRKFDVKTCTDLTKWADKRFDERPTELGRWLAEICEFLEAATKELPQPPSHFARLSTTDCNCVRCGQLADFLKDPALESGMIKARKDELEHVQNQIRRHRLDADSKLDRTTRPFTLMLTKTIGSHDRAVKQYHADIKLCRSLPQP